jgi:hypothetical protein
MFRDVQWGMPLTMKVRAASPREVAKAVRLRKACTVVVAPNIEQIEAEGGLDDLLTSILTNAEANNIPIVFALSRKKLGQARGPTSEGCFVAASSVSAYVFFVVFHAHMATQQLCMAGRWGYGCLGQHTGRPPEGP